MAKFPITTTPFNNFASLALAELVEEFVARINDELTDRYNVFGNMVTSAGGRFGDTRMTVGTTTNGDRCQLDTKSIFRVRSNDASFIYESVVRLDNRFDSLFFAGFADGWDNGITTVAGLESAEDEFAGFISDPNQSPNWLIISRDNGVSTIIDTDVPIGSGHNFLKMVYNKQAPTPSLDYFIGTGDDSSSSVAVGRIITNVAQNSLGYAFYTSNINNVDTGMTLDFLKVICERNY